MLMRTDTFREFDRFAQQALGTLVSGTRSRPTAIPMDAYRNDEEFVVAFDLPGVAPDAIELNVERNLLTVRAERRPPHLGENARAQVSERPLGAFSRQIFLGDGLDTDRIEASHENGVLAVRIPVREQAKPRRVTITSGTAGSQQKVINA
ncbi:Hsp20/alpha crystallin family protein [Micromonospora sp. WMMD1102]|uniref:Hsp20/alpha crystallin family protein n=1 Tax=Micromonospora sp. WMMD1102 TaxID=3016105 RepID=UPI002414F120|nr:Hsp20/alpha crystallin family protein [Micromonospora sp. WMMD1102]MDG4787449.1 Hsp20/alpha crystallin family protein [Micromonospora sp. WMMD1102]